LLEILQSYNFTLKMVGYILELIDRLQLL